MVYHLAYHLDDVPKIVKNSDELRALGPEWFKRPKGPGSAKAAFNAKPRQEQLDILLRSQNSEVAIDRFYKELFHSAPGKEKLDIVRDYRDEHPHLAVHSEWAKPYLAHLPPSALSQLAGSESGKGEKTLPSTAPAGERMPEAPAATDQLPLGREGGGPPGRRPDKAIVKRDNTIAALRISFSNFKGKDQYRRIAKALDEQNIPPPKGWGLRTFMACLNDRERRKATYKLFSRARART